MKRHLKTTLSTTLCGLAAYGFAQGIAPEIPGLDPMVPQGGTLFAALYLLWRLIQAIEKIALALEKLPSKEETG